MVHFKNVIIVTYFSQRKMLYGDTTLPSTLRNTGKGATVSVSSGGVWARPDQGQDKTVW